MSGSFFEALDGGEAFGRIPAAIPVRIFALQPLDLRGERVDLTQEERVRKQRPAVDHGRQPNVMNDADVRPHAINVRS